MKKNLLLSICAAALIAGTWSCNPKDTPGQTPTPPAEPTAEVTLLSVGDADFPSTSCGFELKVASIESYVYQIEEGENKPSPDPTVLYAEETDKIQPVTTDGTSKVVLYGMEGDKAYTIHFAFKIKGEAKYIGKSVSNKTPAYSQLINVITADRREIKVQFNAAPDQYYRYAIVDRYFYSDMRSQFPQGDVDFLLYGGVVSKGPKVVTYADEQPTEMIDSETGEPAIAVVKPGTGFVILYAQCDADGNISFDQTGGGGDPGVDPLLASSIKPNVKNYTEKCADDWYVFNEAYAKFEVWTAPVIKGEGEFVIEKIKMTEHSASFKVTPPASVGDYGVAIMPQSTYDQTVVFAGEDGVLSALLTNATQPASGVQTISIDGVLQKDSMYMLLVIGVCDKIGEVQISKIEKFTPIVSDKPAAELIVTAVPETNPYKVSFNVKSTTGDCTKAIFLMNYVKEWVPMIKSGVTYESMVLQYGAKNLLDVDKINSAAGLTMTFDSWEDIESLLAVTSFTADEKIKTFTQKSRSATEPAKTKVESPLFTSLQGTWNVNYKHFLTNSTKVTEAKFTTVIADKPELAPESFAAGDKQYDALFKYHKNQAIKIGQSEAEATAYATKLVNDTYTDYKEATVKYAQKYRDQNRLVMRGFQYNNNYGGLAYKGPWDLCCDIYYSSYDVDQTFYDYGSKLFLEISKDKEGKDVVMVETNSIFIAPMSNYSSSSFFAGGVNGTNILGGQFPVEIVDENTLKIKYQITYNDVPYKFITAYASNTGTYLHTTASEDIVLTRVAAPVAAPRASAYNLPEIWGGSALGNNSFHQSTYKRTALPTYLTPKDAIVIPLTKSIKSKTGKMVNAHQPVARR